MTESKNRLLSIDLLRGFAVWGMLININLYKPTYWWKGFSHGSWYETTLVDLVYPFFLIIIGVSLSFNYSVANPNNQFFLKVLKRVLRLIVLGIFLKALPYFQNFYVFGTLQCIGYALAIAAFAICFFKNYSLIIAVCLNLLAYLISITTVPWNERWQQGRTLFEQIDLVLIGHTGGVEGVITTLLASGFILFGFNAKNFLTDSTLVRKTILGTLLFALGVFLHIMPANSLLSVPMIPRLFSLSFTMFSLGCSLIAYVLFEIARKLPASSLLNLIFIPFGVNSILAYAGVIGFRKILFDTCLINCTVEYPRFKDWLIAELGGQLGTATAVYIYTSTILGLAWIVCFYLYRKKIFIRI